MPASISRLSIDGGWLRQRIEHGLDFPLIHGNAEAVPYPEASFDFAISEYGACLWADPYKGRFAQFYYE
jgi:ubiquinone/menaquinone biosynthesis C-methylase UbiE